MDLFDAINFRRSIRRYSDKKISREDIEKIVEASIHAPSACDIQGWKFIVIDNPELMKEIVNMGAASFIKNAPFGILVLYDNKTDNLEYMDHIQSAAAAIQNMLLAAYALGIGGCWVCHLPRKQELRKLFGIPKNYDPIAYIAMGYPKEGSKSRPRKYGVKELISYNKFDFVEGETPDIDINLHLKRFFRRLYYLLPFRKYLKPIVDKKFEKKFD